MQWLYLLLAILFEVASTLALRVAAGGRRTWYVGVLTGYAISFVLLTLALHEGLGIGVAYGIWSAVGVALTAVASRWLFDEPLTLVMGAGIALIAVGVVLIETGAH